MRAVGTLLHFKTFDHSSVWDRRRAIISCLRLLNNFEEFIPGVLKPRGFVFKHASCEILLETADIRPDW